MAEKTTWIKLDRNILTWKWYSNNNTKALFIHLLIKANIKEKTFMGLEIRRGQLVTSYKTLSRETGMSLKNLRTAMENLETTEEITRKIFHDYSIITINNYDLYQGEDPTVGRQPEEKPVANKKPRTGSRKKKVIKREETPVAEISSDGQYVPQYWELPLDEKYWGRFKSEDEYYAYRQNGGE